MTKFLLDSGNVEEYKEISELAKEKGSELWGATTNPTLIAKELKDKKLANEQEAWDMQKQIVTQILDIVPGAVSAEVYADKNTTAEHMIEQGREIGKWHERVVVKLPTNKEGFKARTALRKEGIAINNTLVFSQQQIFAICLHEKLMQQEYHIGNKPQPPFISPFLGRLDDRGEDGISLLRNGLHIKNTFFSPDSAWLLSSSIRNIYHVKATISMGCDIMTAPAKVYREWFNLATEVPILEPENPLQSIPAWEPSNELLAINTPETFHQAIESGILDISHPLTEAGIDKFTQDWQSILT